MYKKSKHVAYLHKIYILNVWIIFARTKCFLLPLNIRNLCLAINDRHDKASISFVQQKAFEAEP
jgi:hypothetical protein